MLQNFLPDASVLNAVFYFANYMDTLFQPLGIRTVVSNVENWRSGDQIFVNEEDLYQVCAIIFHKLAFSKVVHSSGMFVCLSVPGFVSGGRIARSFISWALENVFNVF